jgi:putative transposase
VVITYPSSFTEIPATDAILRSQAEKLANELATQVTTLEDLNGLMRTMMKTSLERVLNTEMDVHLQWRGPIQAANAPATNSQATDTIDPVATTPKNRRNGHSKTVCGDMGAFTLKTPRDRNGTFEPQLVAKGQRRLKGFDEKILALYAKGMTTRDVQEIIKELYEVGVSPALVSEITADLDAEVVVWRTRPLDAVWPIVHLGGIVVHVRGENGRVSQHTMYVAVGVNRRAARSFWACGWAEPKEPSSGWDA